MHRRAFQQECAKISQELWKFCIKRQALQSMHGFNGLIESCTLCCTTALLHLSDINRSSCYQVAAMIGCGLAIKLMHPSRTDGIMNSSSQEAAFSIPKHSLATTTLLIILYDIRRAAATRMLVLSPDEIIESMSLLTLVELNYTPCNFSMVFDLI